MTRIVAVTGATGFIGGHLVRHLAAQGWRVRALVRTPSAAERLAAPEVEPILGRLEDGASLDALVQGCQAVVHAAGLIKAKDRDTFFQANADGVAAVADRVAAQTVPPQLVALSSLAARQPALSDYAASKRAGEDVLSNRGRELAWTILRPPVVYGPGDRATLVFFRSVARGLGLLPAPADARVSFIHVDDLCAAVSALLDGRSEVESQTFEPDDGNPDGHTWHEAIETAGTVFGRRPRLIAVPRAALFGVARVNQALSRVTGRPALLSPGKAREIRHRDWVCRGPDLGALCGWRPHWSLPAGFAQTIAWYKENNWL